MTYGLKSELFKAVTCSLEKKRRQRDRIKRNTDWSMLMSAVETAWETIVRDQEEKYLEKHELIKNRQGEYLEKEIKSPLLEFTRNDASQVHQHCTFRTAVRSAVMYTET